MIKKYSLICLMLSSLSAASRTYIKNIVNKTSDVIYELQIPKEKYKALLFPHEKKHLGQWVALREESPLYLAVLKGDADAVFFKAGPDASGECTNNENLPKSIIFWSGQQNLPSAQKHYVAYCGVDDNSMYFDIVIDEHRQPHIVPVDGIEKVREF